MNFLLVIATVAVCATGVYGDCTPNLCRFGLYLRDRGTTRYLVRFDDVQADQQANIATYTSVSLDAQTASDACTANVCGDNSTCDPITTEIFECDCNTYFYANRSQSTFVCLDVNECDNATANTCDTNADCTNISPGFNCTCRDGYTGNGTICNNIDECTTNTNNCSDNATCTDTTPGFNCVCDSGFTGDGYTCTDFDQCANPADNNCSSNANCTDEAGGYNCTCNTGFTGDGFNCTDISECASNPCDANATCTEPTPGTFNCTCDAGLTGDGFTCTDDDECLTNPCDPNASCNNTEGSYTCTCNSGFTGDGFTCTDIDDCQNVTCIQFASCVDAVNNYTCQCDSGYTGDGNVSCTRWRESVCFNFVTICDRVPFDTSLNDNTSTLYQNVTNALDTAIDTFIQRVDPLANLENATYTFANESDGEGDAMVTITACANYTNGTSPDFESRINELIESSECGAISTPNECSLGTDNCPAGTTCFDTPSRYCCQYAEHDFFSNWTINGTFASFDFSSRITADSLTAESRINEILIEKLRQFEPRGCVASASAEFNRASEGSIVFVLQFLVRNTTLTIEEILNALRNATGTDFGFGGILTIDDLNECLDDYADLRNCSDFADCLNSIGSFSCSCNASTYDNGTAFGEANGTVCITPITVSCDGSNMNVSIIEEYYNQQGINISDLRLANDTCNFGTNGVRIGDSIEFSTALNDCGTTLTTSADNSTIIASNYISNRPLTGVFTGTEINVPFECELPTDVNITGRFNGTVATVTLPNVAAVGEFNLKFAFYDSSFTNEKAQTETYASNSIVYGQISVTNSISNVGVKVENSWGTPSSSSTDSNRYDYIDNGCSNGNAQRFNMIQNGDGSARFSFQMFFFSEVNYVYLHARVKVCTPSCRQTCSSRRRRETAEDETETVTLTFVLRLDPNDPMYNNRTIPIQGISNIPGSGGNETTSDSSLTILLPVVSAILAFVLIVLLAFLVIVAVRKRRSTKDVYDMTHVNMHAIGVKPPDY